jgi:cytochrome P450
MRLLSTEASAHAAGPITSASARFDPFDPEYVSDPYAQLADFQSTEPVFFSAEIGSWIVTRFDTIKGILRDNKRYSAMIASDPLTPLCPHARQIIKDSEFNVPPLLVNNDPPSHSRYRAFYSAPLQRERLQALHSFVQATVDEHVERMAVGSSPADLVSALTWDVPALVLFRLLGVPTEDVPKVKHWASSRVVMTWGRPTEDEQVQLAGEAVEYYRYAIDLVRRKAEAPLDDYLSDLVCARGGDDSKATLHEIGATAFNLLFAGHETTSSAAANLFKAVLPRRELWDAICRGTQPLAPVVEEGLRFDSPVQSWRRQAKEAVELDGVQVPAGARLLLVFAAANRDPTQFAEPAEFVPGRRNAMQHVAFGAGAHFCLGAPLARLEIEAMLESVARRLPGMTLVQDQDYPYTPNTSFRALRKLMVAW